VRVVETPAQMLVFEPALTVGNEFTVTVTLDVFEHPFEFVPVTT
jgi:hypothetical protein